MPTLDGSGHEKWAPAEFVVALSHLDVVRAELGRLPHPVEATEEQDERLGLALIRIGNVADVAARLPEPTAGNGRCECRSGPRQEQEYPIERILRAIRDRCSERNGGWVPTMGKNRTLDGVHAAQHIGIGGDGYPEWSRADELPADRPLHRTEVGVLDTGLWPHPQLRGRYVSDDDELSESEEWYSHLAGHATFVAGTILRTAPNARLRVRRVLDDRDGTALAWDVAREMVSFAGSVSVLNLSFCCFTGDNEPPLVLARAIERIGPDTVIVAAAGNHGGGEAGDGELIPVSPRSPMWPAAFDQVIAVGAHDHQGERSTFSPDAAWVNLTAPGEDVTSLYLDGVVRFDRRTGGTPPPETKFDGWARWKGTSFAAAAVSGAIASRIRPGTTARDALHDVWNLPQGNDEDIRRYRPTHSS